MPDPTIVSMWLHPLGYCTGNAVAKAQCHSYNWYSGSGSDVGEVTVLSVFVIAWRHINCEEPGCWRTGHRHPGHGRPVCRRHYHSDAADPRTGVAAGTEAMEIDHVRNI